MSYSRRCGIQTGACGAETCSCVSVDPEGANGPHRAAQRFDVVPGVVKCVICESLEALEEISKLPIKVAPLVDHTADRAYKPCDRPDCPICATRDALQTAHNESREGC